MKYYLKLNPDNVILDVITYAHEGYVEIETDKPLPRDILGGRYKWENGDFVVIPEPEPKSLVDIEQRIADLEAAIAAILGGAV